MIFEKVYENEDNIIGMCFKGNMEKALNGGLTANLFIHPGNKEIFSAMLSSYISHKELSLNAVRLRLNKELADRLMKQERESSLTLNIIYFIGEAKKAAWIARLTDGLRAVHCISKAWKPGEPIDGIINYTSDLQGITVETYEESSRTDETAIDEYLSEILDDAEKGGVKSISTGITEIDEALNGGFRPGKLICIAARPGIGKTALAVNLALSAAEKGNRVQYFSIELLRKELIDRFVCTQSGLDTKTVATRIYSSEQSDKLMSAIEHIRRSTLTLETKTRSSWEIVENAIRKEHRLKGLKVAIVDYIQQFHIRSKKMSSRSEELTEIAERAKAIALELEITVVMVAQLNRSAEDNDDYKPKMSHLKDSGGLEQAADFIGFLHSANAEYKIALSVVKNRLGINGTMHLRVDLSTNKFHRE